MGCQKIILQEVVNWFKNGGIPARLHRVSDFMQQPISWAEIRSHISTDKNIILPFAFHKLINEDWPIPCQLNLSCPNQYNEDHISVIFNWFELSCVVKGDFFSKGSKLTLWEAPGKKDAYSNRICPSFPKLYFWKLFSVSIYQEYLFLESRNFVNIREFFTTLVYLIINHTTLPILFETYKSIVALELPLLTSKLKNSFQFVSDQWGNEE